MIVLIAATIMWLFIGRLLVNVKLTLPFNVSQALGPARVWMSLTSRNDNEAVQLTSNGLDEGDLLEQGQRVQNQAKSALNSDSLVVIFVIDKVLFVLFLFVIIVLHN